MDSNTVLIVIVVVALVIVLWWYLSSQRSEKPPLHIGRVIDFPERGVRISAASNYDAFQFRADPPGAVPPEKKELNIRVIRAVCEVVASDAENKSVLVFDPPLTVTIQYTAADAATAGGAEKLGVFLYSASNNKWKHMIPTLDLAAQTVTVPLSALLGTDDPIGLDF